MSASRKPIARKSADQVRRELHDLARPVAGQLRRSRVRAAALRCDGLALPLLAFPVVYVLFVAVAGLTGADLRLPWFVVALLALVPPGLLLWSRYRDAKRVPVADEAALVAIDRELQLADRLSSAHEFASEAEPTGLKLAAIHDAERRLAEARAARVCEAGAERASGLPLAWAAVAVALLLWLAGRLPVIERSPALVSSEPGRMVAAETETESSEEVREEPRDADQSRVASPRTPRDSRVEAGAAEAGDDETPADARRRGQNPLGSGRSAEARTAQGGGSERGTPSNQAQSTKGDKAKKPGEKREQKPRRDEDERPEEARKPPQQSGSTQGRGSGKGSSKSPTSSPWSAKDQVVTDEEQDPEEDEEVDDESDESKARGGVQPNLRQRKPPVNRDLQISMGGGQPPDDANGRGGPGGPKKQRGVAQLVLGVTFPDHVSAKPNPGISKITQERIEPQAQQGDRIDGEGRGQRSTTMGPLSRPVLRPWMQDLLRSFYLSLRKEGGSQR